MAKIGKNKNLSWSPRRSGLIYCSPACGANCTYTSYIKCIKTADKLIKTLGPSWKSNVFENIGWHCGVISKNGYWKIYPFFHKGKIISYNAYLGEPDSPGGRWAEQGETPQIAIENTLKEAKAAIDEIISLLKGAVVI